jgi:hypothetical protein
LLYNNIMNILYNKALKLGASDFGESKIKTKRFYVVYNDKVINFGSKNGSTFLDHKDKKKKDNWFKRHSKIKNKKGEYVINNKDSPSFWSNNILW